MLYSTLAFAFLAPLVLAAPAEEISARQASISLNARFVAKGKKYFGVATDQNRLTTGKNAAIIQADFGQVTPENSGKWDTIECMNTIPWSVIG